MMKYYDGLRAEEVEEMEKEKECTGKARAPHFTVGNICEICIETYTKYVCEDPGRKFCRETRRSCTSCFDSRNVKSKRWGGDLYMIMWDFRRRLD